MTTRRDLLKAALAAGLVLPAGRNAVRAQGRPLVFCSWGGLMSQLEKDAFMDPAARELGAQIANTSPVSYAKIKAMVEAGGVDWDIVNVGGRFIYQGRDQNLLVPIDTTIVDLSKLEKEWYASHGVFTSTGATVIGWNTKAIPANAGPSSWKDFWNVKDFPGARALYKQIFYNWEAALMAAGLNREEVYPVTDEKWRIVQAKIVEIKPHVKLWWTAGAQPAQLLATGEVALAAIWTGRATDAQKEGAPLAITYNQGIAWGNAFVVPRGTPHRDLAMRVINYCIGETAQMRLADAIYGPVLSSAAAKASPERQAHLVTSPQNRAIMLVQNDEQSAIYGTRYEEGWAKLQLV